MEIMRSVVFLEIWKIISENEILFSTHWDEKKLSQHQFQYQVSDEKSSKVWTDFTIGCYELWWIICWYQNLSSSSKMFKWSTSWNVWSEEGKEKIDGFDIHHTKKINKMIFMRWKWYQIDYFQIHLQ